MPAGPVLSASTARPAPARRPRRPNWSYLAPTRRRPRDRFFDRLYRYVEDAEPTNLAGVLARQQAPGAIDPVGQMPQWLFAFDAAGMTSLRALALLATHPAQDTKARFEMAQAELPSPLPYLRSCILESIRLWPTTPLILRDTTADTEWCTEGKRFTVEAGAALMILVPAFHRDPAALEFADSFTPDIWLDGRAQAHPELVPFSAGLAQCPCRNLVLFTTTTLLAHLMQSARFEMVSRPLLAPADSLPLTLNNFGLDFATTPEPFRASPFLSPVTADADGLWFRTPPGWTPG